MIDKQLLLWISGCLAISLLPHLARLPLWFIPFFLIIIGFRLLADLRAWKPLPLVVRVVLTLSMVMAIIVEHGHVLGREPGLALMAVMLTLKFTELYKRRDALVVICMCYFLTATQFLFSQSLMVMPYFLVATIVSTALLLQLSTAGQFAFTRKDERPVLAALKASSIRLAYAIPVMLILFLLFPRLSSPLWKMPGDNEDAKTGLSDSMSPGSIQELFIDDSPAFRVRFDAAIPQPNQLYWRGPVMWDYDGREWTAKSLIRSQSRQHTLPDNISKLSYQVSLEPSHRRWLLTLDVPISGPKNAHLSQDLQLISRSRVSQLKQYQAVSTLQYVWESELLSWERRAGLDYPRELNTKTQTMMTAWRNEGLSNEELILRALRFFREEPFIYSFSPPLLGRNAVDDFLFETRNGYCEHYSSTFAIMMRMAGIPSRIVTGYQGGYFNDISDYILVRQSDAHAWVEVWLEDQGWVRIDPTSAVAPERVMDGAFNAMNVPRGAWDYAWIRDLRNRFDTINAMWNDIVIDFNTLSQKELFKPLGLGDLAVEKQTLLMVTLLSTIAAILAWLMFRNPSVKDDELIKLFVHIQRRLSRFGIQPRKNEGPRTYAARVLHPVPETARHAAIGAAMALEKYLYGELHRNKARQKLLECLDSLKR